MQEFDSHCANVVSYRVSPKCVGLTRLKDAWQFRALCDATGIASAALNQMAWNGDIRELIGCAKVLDRYKH